MPQYKTKQYGIKQYGVFQSSGSGGGNSSRKKWIFIRSRFGCVRKGKTFWLYTHTPIKIEGKISKMRIKANKQTWIQEESIQIKGKKTKMRLKSNRQDDWLSGQSVIS